MDFLMVEVCPVISHGIAHLCRGPMFWDQNLFILNEMSMYMHMASIIVCILLCSVYWCSNASVR